MIINVAHLVPYRTAPRTANGLLFVMHADLFHQLLIDIAAFFGLQNSAVVFNLFAFWHRKAE